jgi:ribonuclease HI
VRALLFIKWVWDKIQSPAGEPSALFLALRHISEDIRPPERCLIVTDNLSSIKAMLSRKVSHQTHPLVSECTQLCWSLCQNGVEVMLMWIPSLVGLVENELVDERARQAAVSSGEFQSLARTALMRAWQAKWDSADTGRLTHSIFPDVTLPPGLSQAKRRREVLFALCQGFNLDIVLFNRILVDFELLKI